MYRLQRIGKTIADTVFALYKTIRCFFVFGKKDSHTMFDTPYPVDSKRTIKIYKKLKQELTLLQKQISFKNLGKTATGKKHQMIKRSRI